jgi:hypothetical protein
MRTVLNISKRINSINSDNLFGNRKIVSLNNTYETIWKGAKRYAH